MQRNTDFRLTAMVSSKSASVRSSMPRISAMPALLIRMSIGPSLSCDRSHHRGDGGALGDIGRQRNGIGGRRL